MLMYTRQKSVSTQPGGRPTIVFSGDVSSTRQHSNRGTPLEKKNLRLGIIRNAASYREVDRRCLVRDTDES